jgi:hypothetical protein
VSSQPCATVARAIEAGIVDDWVVSVTVTGVLEAQETSINGGVILHLHGASVGALGGVKTAQSASTSGSIFLSTTTGQVPSWDFFLVGFKFNFMFLFLLKWNFYHLMLNFFFFFFLFFSLKDIT